MSMDNAIRAEQNLLDGLGKSNCLYFDVKTCKLLAS